MSEKQYHLYAKAFTLACLFKGLIEDACTRVEIAGSILRKRTHCSDIEVVCIPRTGIDMFGDPVYTSNKLDARIDDLLKSGIITNRVKNGSRFKQFQYEDMTIDLFIVLGGPVDESKSTLPREFPAQWGVIFAIRTGSAMFSKFLVTTKNQGGALPSNAKVDRGRLFIEGEFIETPEEMDFFRAIELTYIDPTMRM